jgi:hypothetical protein
MSKELPFLEYVVHYVLYYADSAQCGITQQHVFLDEFPLGLWILLNNLFERYRIRRLTSNASLLYILAEKGLPKLILDVVR